MASMEIRLVEDDVPQKRSTCCRSRQAQHALGLRAPDNFIKWKYRLVVSCGFRLFCSVELEFLVNVSCPKRFWSKMRPEISRTEL
ncbi:hypothetical protein P3T76_010684 [Phytophthora citrophthora]|uniref:Uncharacterized protein n=1 Tax=Phytophthora citrophthora TaxID=4793 RepID=A0AAD9GBR3_9STRA|nr:hypothetical protein P3T76_010684 [Phytophthora citrophthora]